MLQSYLNMLKVIQITNGGEEDLKFQIKIKAVNDEDVVQKVKDFFAILFQFSILNSWVIKGFDTP